LTQRRRCYQRVEDARPRVCVHAVCREAVLHSAHRDINWQDIQELTELPQLCHMRFIGLVYTRTLLILCARVKRVPRPKVSITNVWERSYIQLSQ